MKLRDQTTTTAPVSAGDTTRLTPEFGRMRDVETLYGLKRGTTYNLLNDGKIRGCVLRVRGQRTGVRLIDLASVREYIVSEMSKPTNDEQGADV
jgi:hypothetical protein